jgi:hypothetical protein
MGPEEPQGARAPEHSVSQQQEVSLKEEQTEEKGEIVMAQPALRQAGPRLVPPRLQFLESPVLLLQGAVSVAGRLQSAHGTSLRLLTAGRPSLLASADR